MIQSDKNQSQLPKGWTWVNLEDLLLKISNGITQRQNKDGIGIPISRIETISNGTIDLEKVGYLENLSQDVIEKYKLLPGDILFSHINSDFHLGKTALFHKPDITLLHGMNLLLIRVNEEIIRPIYLHYLFNNLRFSGYFISIAQHAVNQSSINQKKLKKVSIQVPPLPEQHRIVAKNEKLFAKLDAGVEALNRIKAQLKRYRQAVLKYAFEGKLTEEWREAHKTELEPASVLLKRIKEERKKKEEGKIKELPPLDAPNLPELPEIWVWTITTEVCSSVRDGTHDTPKYVDGGVPLITSKNLKEYGLDFSTTKNISLEDHKIISIRSGVEQGDILFAMIGTIGNPVVIETEKIFSIKNVALFKKNETVIKSKYLRYWLASPIFYEILEQRKFLKGTTQKFIPLEYLRILPVPFSPFPEQQKIVEEIESLVSIADEAEKVIEHCLKQAERLRQSILKKAFEGKLVPQDPNDEPTEKLLERIKSEKANREVKEKTKKKGKKMAIKQMELI